MAYQGPPGQDLEELFEVQQPPPPGHSGFVTAMKSLGITKPRREVHRDGDWHRSVHVWVVDPTAGCAILQKRSPHKDTNPDKWDVGSAGHIAAGEESRATAAREVLEELGLPIPDPSELEYLFTVVSSAKGSSLKFGPFLDNEYQDVYLLLREGVDVASVPRNTEVSDVKAVTLVALRDAWLGGDPDYVAHSRRYLERLFSLLVDRVGRI
jgi:8-oxo-dGTP pyrophosphatase MutT (NUDIX family)